MPDLAELIRYWWKQMLIAVILSVLVVGIITFLKPRQYLSVATAVPASSFTADRSAIFNENIQALYSTLGTTDDLDRILGTAQLDTVYLAMADAFNLFDHYRSTKGPSARIKAAQQLKANVSVMRSGYGELKIKVWDTDKNLAPQLANAMMALVNTIQQSAQNESNIIMLENLKAGRKKIAAELDSLINSLEYDSTNALIRSSIITQESILSRGIRRDALLGQLGRYEKLINEYQLMADSRNAALIVIEKARASETPDRPKRMYIMIATLVLSFLFSLLLALVLHRKKTSQA